MSLDPDSVTQFTEYLATNGASPNTIRAYKSDLTKFLVDVKFRYDLSNQIGAERQVASYITLNRTYWSPSTVNRKLAAFRTYASWVGWTGFLANYKAPKTAPGVAHPIPEGIEGILKMIEAGKNNKHKALVTLCGLCGLRMTEARSIRPINLQHHKSELSVRGKGDKTRVIPLSRAAEIHLISRYIESMQSNELFVPYSDKQARRIITQLGVCAGLSQPVSSHDLRMTFGTAAYYKSGGDIRAVQELLGHASSHTTENYTQVSMDAMRKAAEIV